MKYNFVINFLYLRLHTENPKNKSGNFYSFYSSELAIETLQNHY
jgi:hypothetical protein